MNYGYNYYRKLVVRQGEGWEFRDFRNPVANISLLYRFVLTLVRTLRGVPALQKISLNTIISPGTCKDVMAGVVQQRASGK